MHHLMHHVHEVRCEPGLIEFRPEPRRRSTLPPGSSDLLGQWTGRRWIASVSSGRRQSRPWSSRKRCRATSCAGSRARPTRWSGAILKTFPGAKLDTVRRKGEQASSWQG